MVPSRGFHRFCLAVTKSALVGFPNRKNNSMSECSLLIYVFCFTKYFAAHGHAALISGALQNILLRRTMSRHADYPGKTTVSEVWSTKYGPRRVRFDPPTLKEAIAAARGLTDELQLQTEIAASLMGLPIEAVRGELLKTAPARSSAQIMTNGREGIVRTVVVERKRRRVRRP
jgi:hypothetical protein